MDTQEVLDQAVDLFKEELGGNLVGIYLHGSLAMGCFNPDTSDIDLLLVVADKLTSDHMRRLAKKIIAFHDGMPNQQGVELSLVLESSLQELVYPPPFEFHYSTFHREKYLNDDDYLCGGFQDADLAAHFTVIYHRGITLYGKPIQEVFTPVDRQHYIQAILHDVEGAVEDITDSPMYYTLNLCRVLYYLKDGVVSSKKEGGEWGLRTLPSKYHPMIERALLQYSGIDQTPADFSSSELTAFAGDMLELIRSSSA
ncbi:aminoglycoside adenylyltransferase domain-containing protein [Paenibacillus lautus]|uniref:aminoglycoside adenylyltransferase domain-containing protein n=1 Tax=Paenibacillus lautus TaxID=1401 RepID=UPI003D2A4CBE